MVSNIIAGIAALISLYALLNKSSVISRQEASKQAQIKTYQDTIKAMEESIKFYNGQEEKIADLTKKVDILQRDITAFKISDNIYKIAFSCRSLCSMKVCTIIDKLNELRDENNKKTN